MILDLARSSLAALSFAFLVASSSTRAQDAVPREVAAPSGGSESEAAAMSPRYFDAMRTELGLMRVPAMRCEATDADRSRCTFTTHGVTTGREFHVHLVYSDRTDTIYVYVEDYLRAPPSDAHTPAVLRRLMELNWAMLLGKFEWDSDSGEVRIAMVLNTDSNFDRRAFRSAVRDIGQLADRYYGELSRVARE